MASSVGGLGSDVFFRQLISGALGASWGAEPAENVLMAGPASHLDGRLVHEIGNSGVPWLTEFFPTPTFSTELSSLQGGFPPFLQPGGFNFFDTSGTATDGFSGIPGFQFDFFG